VPLTIRYLMGPAADNRLVEGQFFQRICRRARTASQQTPCCSLQCITRRASAKRRCARESAMRRQHQRATGGRDQAALPIRYLAPGGALGMSLDRFQRVIRPQLRCRLRQLPARPPCRQDKAVARLTKRRPHTLFQYQIASVLGLCV
jgi:hypothetical protein